MSGKALLGGLKRYVTWLVITVVVPLLWLRSLRLAGHHAQDDARGRMKVVAAIGISLVIGVGGYVWLDDFKTSSREGMYDALDGRLAIATGESRYQEAVTASTETLPSQIGIIQGKIVEAEAAGNDTSELEANLALAQKTLATEMQNVSTLAPNHALYLQIQAAVEDQDDAGAKSLIERTDLDYQNALQPRADNAFAIKDKAEADMESAYLWFLYPSLIGAFYAPLAFANGSILRRAFVESDTVGYKPYPGKAAGFFLLLGAFGVPSIPFAAWTFMDMERRSSEGQIAL